MVNSGTEVDQSSADRCSAGGLGGAQRRLSASKLRAKGMLKRCGQWLKRHSLDEMLFKPGRASSSITLRFGFRLTGPAGPPRTKPEGMRAEARHRWKTRSF